MESKDGSYDNYDNRSNTASVHNTVGSKFIAAKNLESSNINNVPSSPSAVLPGVIKAEQEVPDIVSSEKLIDIKTECNSDFNKEEIDFSEDIKPFLLPAEPNVETDDGVVRELGLDPGNVDINVEQPECVDLSHKPNVETDNENIKECDLDPGNADTNVEHPECVNSSHSDKIDINTVDNGFSTSFGVECKKKLTKQIKSKRPAVKRRRRGSLQKEAKGKTCRAKNKGKAVKQNQDKKTLHKSVSGVKTNDTQSLIAGTRSATRAKLIQQYIPPTSRSSRTLPSSISSSPAIDQPDERLRKKKILREKERRKIHVNLIKELKMLVPDLRYQSRTSELKILTFSKKYIDELKQNLLTKQQIVEHLTAKKISIQNELNNLIIELQNLQNSS